MWPLTCVGDTGFEPVTSSVSSNDHGTRTSFDSAVDQGGGSVNVRGCPRVCTIVVTQLATQCHACAVWPCLSNEDDLVGAATSGLRAWLRTGGRGACARFGADRCSTEWRQALRRVCCHNARYGAFRYRSFDSSGV